MSNEANEIKGNKFKLAGIEVVQKGTLVDVFARFCGIEDDVQDILAKRDAERQAHENNSSEPFPRFDAMVKFDRNEVCIAVAGKKDLSGPNFGPFLTLDGKNTVAQDLGRLKMALVLAEMGEAYDRVLAQGQSTFVQKTPDNKSAQRSLNEGWRPSRTMI